MVNLAKGMIEAIKNQNHIQRRNDYEAKKVIPTNIINLYIKHRGNLMTLDDEKIKNMLKRKNDLSKHTIFTSSAPN